PVTQNTKRFVRCFWALDKSLAYARHYPAINWITSYSEYMEDLAPYYKEHVGADFMQLRQEINTLLIEENKLMEIVKLIGADVLPDDQKLIIEIAKVIRVGFLQQNAFHKDDTYVPMEKQRLMMKTILELYHKALEAINGGIMLSTIMQYNLFDKLVKMKYDISNDKPEMFDDYIREIDDLFDKLTKGED
ncbi:MAG: V-type ATP synthase subunit A, partial [Ruminiclostridium sp.]